MGTQIILHQSKMSAQCPSRVECTISLSHNNNQLLSIYTSHLSIFVPAPFWHLICTFIPPYFHLYSTLFTPLQHLIFTYFLQLGRIYTLLCYQHHIWCKFSLIIKKIKAEIAPSKGAIWDLFGTRVPNWNFFSANKVQIL